MLAECKLFLNMVAGLYRHYKDKEDMFASLVDETLTEYGRLCRIKVR